jgi:3D (Asp-Asp-Asp) domain-containing protein
MIPLDHFRYIGGCGLETGADGSLRLIRNNRVFTLYADSLLLVCEDKTLAFPIAPYEAHGFLYVPLRFLCEALDMGIQWRAKSDAVVLHSLWADANQITGPLTALNQTLLAAFAEEEWSDWFERLEPVDIAVTFYSSDRNPPYTASGYIAEAGSLAADSRIPYGTQYYIPELAMIKEDAIFTVHDRGGAVTGDLLDVFVPAHLQGDPAVYAVLRRGRFKTEGYRIHSEG